MVEELNLDRETVRKVWEWGNFSKDGAMNFV
jgi:hypothetical protein